MSYNPRATHQYARSAVATMPQEQLVVELYRKAIACLEQAATALEQGKTDRSRDRAARAEDILNTLNTSLDMDAAPDLCAHLRSIYLFCKRLIWTGRAKNLPDMYRQVAALLKPLREGWEAVAARVIAERETQVAAAVPA